MKKHQIYPSAIVLMVCMGVTGCASSTPKNYRDLSSSSRLQPNPEDTSGKVPYIYKTQVAWKDFSSVIIEPVEVYHGTDHQFGDMSQQDKKALAAYMQDEFTDVLRRRFSLTDNPKPWTLRVKLTLTGAETNTPVVSTVLRFDLVGGPYNIVQGLRGKEGMVMGSVSYSVEVYEALTNRLLKAYVTKEYPNAMNIKATLGSLAASKAGIDKGAEDLLSELN
ncbi:DUF3313 domain-containing protein [Methylovorus sp. SPW-M1]